MSAVDHRPRVVIDLQSSAPRHPSRPSAPSRFDGRRPPEPSVLLHGDHDVATRESLARVLVMASDLHEDDLVIDMSGVTFMDAATLGVLAETMVHLNATGRTLHLTRPSRCVARIMDVCGTEDVADALGSARTTDMAGSSVTDVG